MEQQHVQVIQHTPAIRTVPLLLFIGGALLVLCLACFQVPASIGYLLTAALSGVLCVSGGAYLLRSKPEWGWTIYLIPVFVHSTFGEKYYPYRSTGFVDQFILYAEWLAVALLTVTIILAIVAILQQRSNVNHSSPT